MEFRKELKNKLCHLKEDYGVVSIKAEFEAEGSRKDELIMLSEMAEAARLGLTIKIGGCEAVHDIDQCKLLNASGIMAPMIETPFAMDKFLTAIKKVYHENLQIEKIINAETITCFRNFDSIIKHGEGFLTGVTVGRSDLSASMGIDKKNIEGEDIYNITKQFCKKAQDAGLISNFGGNIGMESIPFIIDMYPYIDRFETRKVIMLKSKSAEYLRTAIKAALEFELMYLQFKSQYYMDMANEDIIRIERLKNQVSSIRDV